MTDWGARHTPLWPTREEIVAAAWAGDAAWEGGPALRDLLLELRPLIRLYFLLGYRVRTVTVMDLLQHPAGTSPPDGRPAIDLATGTRRDAPAITEVASPGRPVVALATAQIHIVFGLETCFDDSGYLHGLAGAPPDGHFRGYGADLGDGDTVLSLTSAGADVAGFRPDTVALFETLYAIFEALPPFARAENGGMAWVFDSRHWLLLAAGNRRDRTEPAHLVDNIAGHPQWRRRFLFEQLFGLRLRALFFTVGDAPGAADCFAEAASGAPTLPGAPNFWHYDYTAPLNAPGGAAHNVRTRDWRDRIAANLAARGESHLWSYGRRLTYEGDLPESWLDTILSLAWEGAVGIPDAVVPRAPPEPLSIVELSATKVEIWVHDWKALDVSLTYPNERAGSLAARIAVDYKPGGDDARPVLMLVAGRGVAIVPRGFDRDRYPPGAGFKPFYDAWFRAYDAAFPWDLEIYRVQDDRLIPPRGADINPATLLGPGTLNPSPMEPVPDPDHDGYRPTVPLVLPVDRPGASRLWMVSNVRIQPLAHGVRIEFPVSHVQDPSAIPDEAEGERIFNVDVAGMGYWEIYVNPFSGHAAYTYDLYLERFDRGGAPKIVNLHPVILVADDEQGTTTNREVELTSSLASDQDFFQSLYAFLIGGSTVPADHPGFWGVVYDTAYDATGEYWWVKRGDLWKLPVPLEDPLPVTDPTFGRFHDLLADPQVNRETDRLTQTTLRMPPDSETGWISVPLAGRNVEIKRFHSGEMTPSGAVQGVLMMIDLALGLIPIVGDAIEMAEFAKALMTGRDRWGRPVTSFDLALMGVGAAVPFLSSSSLEVGHRIANNRTVYDDIFFQDPNHGPLFRRISGLLEAPPDQVEVNALEDAVSALIDLNRGDRRFTPTTPAHRERVRVFTRELIRNKSRVVGLLERAEDGVADQFLKLEDVLTPNGDGFIFSIFQTEFLSVRSNLPAAERADFTPRIFLRRYAGTTTRAAARALIAEDVLETGARIRHQPLRSPSFAARLPRPGDDVSLASLSGADLIPHVVQYFNDVLAGEPRIMLKAAGNGADYMMDARQVLVNAGVILDDLDQFDEGHAVVTFVKALLGGQSAGYPRTREILVGTRQTARAMPAEECGARVGEAVLLSLDQLVHMNGIDEVVGAAQGLDTVRGGRLTDEVTDFVGQWVNGNGNAWEHALKSELREGVEVKARLHKLLTDPEPGDAPLAARVLDVRSQARLPSRDGRITQKGQDFDVFYEDATGVVRQGDWQVKAYKTIEGASGFEVIDEIPVQASLLMGGAPPRVTQRLSIDAADDIAIYEWDVEGGSAIFRQIIKNRLRRAHYKGKAPPPGLTQAPPPHLPTDHADWVEAGTRNVYVIDSIYTMNELISKLSSRVPRGTQRNVHFGDLDDSFTVLERRLLEILYPELGAVPPAQGLNLHKGEELYDRFTLHKEDLRSALNAHFSDYLARVDGLEDALRDIGGPDFAIEAHQTYIRFTTDESVDTALRFMTGVPGT